jgi:GNAT superfamily N-acetyltransferase
MALVRAGLPATDRVIRDFVFACGGELVRQHPLRSCRRLVDASVPAADGLCLPSHCFPDGVVYGVVCEGRVVSVAFAHRAGVLEDVVADVGVETAPRYRRRGFAQAAVSALAAHFTERGGESRYSCNPDNVASIATARSVGFVRYGKSLILSSPRLVAAKQ